MSEPGTLYVVGTPIGNLEDITLRALRVLKEVDLIAAEDTRVTRKLLSHFDIHTPLTSYHQHTRGDKEESLAERLVTGQNIALVSDAGMPGISDPGVELIARAIALGAPVVPVPGASAAISGLVISGLPTAHFAFDGFPPRPKGERREFFDALRDERRTTVLYEAPTRLLQTLEELYGALGDRPVAVARELTKLFEEVYRGDLRGGIEHFRAHKPRGEFTVVVGGAPAGQEDGPASGEEDLRRALKQALADGVSSRDAVAQVAARMRLPRRLVYSTLLSMKELDEGDSHTT